MTKLPRPRGRLHHLPHALLLLVLTATPATPATPATTSTIFSNNVLPCAVSCVISKLPDINTRPGAVCLKHPNEDYLEVKNTIYGCVDSLEECRNKKQEWFWDSVEGFCDQAVAEEQSSSSTMAETKTKTSTATSTARTSRSRTTVTATPPAGAVKPSASVSASAINTGASASATTAASSASQPPKKSLSSGAIAGIVIGVLAALALAAAALWAVLRNRRNHRQQARNMSLEPHMTISAPAARWAPLTSVSGTPTGSTWRGLEKEPVLAPAPGGVYVSRASTASLTQAAVAPPPRNSAFLPPLKIDASTAYTPDTHNHNDDPPSPVSPVTPYTPRRTHGSRASVSSSIISAASLSDAPPLPVAGGGGMSRADSVAWREQVGAAAARASRGVVESEQEESAERREMRRRGTWERVARRWSGRSGEDPADDVSSLGGGSVSSRPGSGNGGRRKSGVVIV
ncbi:hypothetical protein EDC01DRAFT_655798 [Geopyxis carbonaria]|nr:hypothetical protein EDC01DRAFT_655798 [Geopyxis carbonaria]